MAVTEFFPDAARFVAVIEPLVGRDRVGSVMVSQLVADHLTSPYPEPPLLAAVRDAQQVLLAAVRVPGYPMVVVVDPELEDAGRPLEELTDALLDGSEPMVGFVGRRRTAQLIAQAWAQRTGSTATPRMWELYYRLGELREPVGVPGEPRRASVDDPADIELLADWFCRFREETGIGRTPPVPDPNQVLRGAQRGEVITLWCVAGVPVAVAGHSAVRCGASKIAPVYTAPAQRRRGFGAAVTAAAVHSAMELGAVDITLFTDAEYHASNACYRGLGFEVVGEFAEIDVEPAAVNRLGPGAMPSRRTR